MSDGLPTDDQLRRIERGVRDRIERRRRVARGVVGATAGVLLLAGGIALVRTGGTSTAGGSTAAGAASSAGAVVLCHASSAADSPVHTAAAAGKSDAALVAACTEVDFQSGTGRMPSPTRAPEDQASRDTAGLYEPAVVCRAPGGVLHVFPADGHPTTLCVRNGMQPA